MERDSAVILVVEDEVLIRMDAVEQLERLGYELEEAANCDQALVVLAGERPIDVLFTDVDMPGELDGLELARRVSLDHPEMGIIITSGKSLEGKGPMPEGSVYFPKPYASGDLNGAIQRLLEVS